MLRWGWIAGFGSGLLCLAGCASTIVPAPPPSLPVYGSNPAVPIIPIRYAPTEPQPGRPAGQNWGRFEGELHVELVGDRDGRLLNDFDYLDPHGKLWIAPTGSMVNGASIPKVFWSIIGGPWDGAYRQASVVHDVACVRMNEPWPAVHRMFYEACRCGGVDERLAKMMYWAVYHFGPRWELRTEERMQQRLVNGVLVSERITVSVPQRTQPAPPTEALARQAAAYFQQNSPELEEIPGLKFGDE